MDTHQCPGCRDIAMAQKALEALPEFSRVGTTVRLVPNLDLLMWQGVNVP